MASAATLSVSLFLWVLIVSPNLLASGVIVSTGRLLPPPLFASDAKRKPGGASSGVYKGPRVGANKQANGPTRCQPWIVSDSTS
jgi:hypothetical protein